MRTSVKDDAFAHAPPTWRALVMTSGENPVVATEPMTAPSCGRRPPPQDVPAFEPSAPEPPAAARPTPGSGVRARPALARLPLLAGAAVALLAGLYGGWRYWSPRSPRRWRSPSSTGR
nr:hypothetical protein GCM10020093_007210 [Planobispora longispora]